MKNALNPVDQRAANNLKSIWLQHKEKRKTTQSEFAESIGISQSKFALYLNGHYPISLNNLVFFADALDCNCSDIRPEVKDKR